jgi:thiazole synthase ThiGH ThiG subunit
MRATGTDRGAVRVGYITKLAVALAIIGVFGYDGVSILAVHITTSSDAANAADAASANWQQTHNVTLAYAAASAAAADHHETVLTCQTCFTIAPDNTVHVELRRDAHTLLFSRVGFLKAASIVTEPGTANHDPA